MSVTMVRLLDPGPSLLQGFALMSFTIITFVGSRWNCFSACPFWGRDVTYA